MFLTSFNFLYSTVLYIISSICMLMSVFQTVVPLGVNVGLVGAFVYYATKLKKPDPKNELSIFGPVPGSEESKLHPEKVVRCIAHRGAALDAPENTLEAFKYCIDQDCKFIELDVRTSKDGKLVLLHDTGLERLTDSSVCNIRLTEWDKVKHVDVGAKHPNRQKFKAVHLCLLDDALDYLLEKQARVIIDIKGEDKEVIEGVLKAYRQRHQLYEHAAITCFNPFVLYQIRRKDPKIVGAMSYRPYMFSATDYDAENGPSNFRFEKNILLRAAMVFLDFLHTRLWRHEARWCGVSAVLLHKDIVSPSEVEYWRDRGVRCAGWCVNRPLEKLYWRGILKAPYLANTLVGEADLEQETHTANETQTVAEDTIDSTLLDDLAYQS
ncbi:hypothetical protein O0L34_g7894 [Tuta absoluta]|nr:hypothetical protein O0L34_g7894 [Tuta absoluta]